MNSKTKKYFVSALAVLLILSNFSFATTFMLCDMGMDAGSCSCSKKLDKDRNTVTIKKLKSSCCNTETIELSNSNQLHTVKNDLTANSLEVIKIINDINNNYYLDSGVPQNLVKSFAYPLPNSDIPIINSSLLI